MSVTRNNIAFKGALGEQFVREITVNHRTVTSNELLQASKGNLLGLDTTKVGDIFEAFTSSLIRETKEKISMREQMENLAKDLPEKIREAIHDTEEAIFSSIRPVLADKDKQIAERDKIIAELRQQLQELQAKIK